ncbi:hypothetical protein [Microbacterium sp. P04]|uniref:hypothetical protein n=1 Tax=Microbacterium sp. P04 TaxID=3366947 RepID=UPI0037459055
MGVNDDQLSPGEQDELRQRLVLGARRIKPAGAHRRAIITSTVALALIAGLSATALGAANFLRLGDAAAPITTPTATKSPSQTPSRTPTPTPTQTPSPSTSSVPSSSTIALGGDCTRALSADEASQLVGETVRAWPRLAAYDPAVLGGVACSWTGPDETWALLGVGVYPYGVVTPDIEALTAQTPECSGGGECAYAERYGDAWVYAWGSNADQVRAAVSIVGPRASLDPGVSSSVPAGAWAAPDCESLRAFIGEQLGRDDLVPFAGDAHPQGMEWDLLTANGAAAWCSALGDGDGSLMEQFEVFLGPGAVQIEPAALTLTGAAPITVPGASEAWFVAGSDIRTPSVLVSADGNVLQVSARFLDEQSLIDLTGALLAQLGSA